MENYVLHPSPIVYVMVFPFSSGILMLVCCWSFEEFFFVCVGSEHLNFELQTTTAFSVTSHYYKGCITFLNMLVFWRS
jgi:hypothetical protein